MDRTGGDVERPIVTVDVVIFTLVEDELRVALCQRPNRPFAGVAGLPGGYVRIDQDVDLDAAAKRVLRDKADLGGAHLEQLGTFSGLDRDPRGWSLSAAYVAVVPATQLHGAQGLQLLPPTPTLPGLPFDHDRIVEAGLARIRAKSLYSTLPAFLLPSEFTVAELRDVYRLVLGVERLDLAGFRKKVLDLGVIEPIEGAMRTGAHRPAQLYRRTVGGVAVFDRTI